MSVGHDLPVILDSFVAHLKNENFQNLLDMIGRIGYIQYIGQ